MSSSTLWGLSLSLLTANWLLALLGGAAVTMLVIRSRVEEANLAERFGDEYRAYARRTGRFFPSLGRGSRGVSGNGRITAGGS